MRIRCPHCSQGVEIVENDPLVEVDCPSCGSRFKLVGGLGDTTKPYHRRAVAHFDLLDELGRGAFGSVWKARDRELDREVAVKLPRKEQLDDEESEQFLREARAAAQLRHPNVVGVHEVGRDDWGQLYIVSDLIEGATLAQWLDTKTPSTEQAVDLVICVCEAVQHAHDQGVVHRDLKPQNILMDSEGTPHITDFGLAKRDAGEITITVEGRVLGTPAYMSPEQASGKAHSVDGRSDIYSIGVILFQILTGELPFRGSPRMLILQILNDDPPGLRKLNSRIPADLDTICMKALAKEPAERFATAEELAAELKRWRRGQPIKTRPTSRPERLWRWCKRNPTVAGLSAAVFMALSIALAVSIQFALHSELARKALIDEQLATARERDEKSDALAAALAAREHAMSALRALTDGIVENQLARSGYLQERDKAFLRRILERYEGFASISAVDAESRAIRAEGLSGVGRMQTRLAEHASAAASFRQAIQISKGLVDEFPQQPQRRIDLANNLAHLGSVLLDLNLYDEAETVQKELIDVCRALVDRFPEEIEHRRLLADAWRRFGSILRLTSRFSDAEDAHLKSREMHEKLVGESPLDEACRSGLADCINSMAVLYRNTKDFQKSVEFHRQAVQLRESLVNDFPDEVDCAWRLAVAQHGLAMSLRRNDELETAKTACEASIELMQPFVDQFPGYVDYRRQLAATHNSHAILLQVLNRKEDAERAYGQSHEEYVELMRRSPEVVAFRHGAAGIIANRAMLARDRRDFEKALTLLAEALPLCYAVFETNKRDPNYRRYLRNILRETPQNCAAVGDRTRAMDAAVELRDLEWEPPRRAYDAASSLARCLPMIESVHTGAQDQREAEMQFYADRAMEMLQTAVDRGFKDVETMMNDKYIAPIREREDFRQLVSKLQPTNAN